MKAFDVEEIDEREERGLVLSLRQKVLLAFSLYLGICVVMLSLSATGIVESWRQVLSGSPESESGDATPVDGERTRYVTLFREDFNLSSTSMQTRGVSLLNGHALINLTKFPQQGIKCPGLEDNEGGSNKWLYVSLEARLKVESDDGNGTKFLGFVNIPSPYDPTYPYAAGQYTDSLMFTSYSSSSDSLLVGTWAETQIDGTIVQLEPLIGVDMQEWHTYAIVWRPENATFLVDGEVITVTNQSPSVPMSFWVLATNLDYLCIESTNGVKPTWRGYPIYHSDVLVKVDHIHVYMTQEQSLEYHRNASQTMAAAQGVVDAANSRGLSTETMIAELHEAQTAYEGSGYVPGYLFSTVLTLSRIRAELLDEMSDLFTRASERIRSLKDEGKDTRLNEARYSRAVAAWNEYDLTLAKVQLQYILDES